MSEEKEMNAIEYIETKQKELMIEFKQLEEIKRKLKNYESLKEYFDTKTVRYIHNNPYDGCTCGYTYECIESPKDDTRYIVLENDFGGTSNLLKEKFEEIKEKGK